MAETLPYYYTADGQCPPWFEGEKFVYKKFDPTLPHTPKGETYTLTADKSRKIENPYDLRNLRIINPEFVVSALQQLEQKMILSLDLLSVLLLQVEPLLQQ